MAKPSPSTGSKNASMVFIPIAAVVLVFQALAGFALVLTGNWTYNPPEVMLMINPIVGWVDGLHRLNPVPEGSFAGFQNGQMYCDATAIAFWAVVQWLGPAVAIDGYRMRNAF